MTTPTRALPPSLTDYQETGEGGARHIALTFDAAMAAGRGAVYITDGALQEVIDRATGAPALQVVGATDTHRIDAANLVIAGNVVALDVAGLLPGHTYSLVMDGGVLVSDAQAAFGGVRSSSQLQFTTAPAGDLPQVDRFSTSGSVLNGGGTIALTLTFTEAVPALPQTALHAPNATVTGLFTDDGGITWHATLKAPAGAVTEPVNTFSLDMNQVADAGGHHGSGSDALFTYKVDTRAPAVAALNLDGASLTAGHGIVATLTFSEAVTGVAAALSAGHAGVRDVHSLDGGVTWLATLTGQDAATAQGNVLALDLAKVRDLAGNAGSGIRTSGAYTVDTQAPRALAIALDGTLLAGGHGVTVTFTFSEAVRDLPAAAVDTPHATLSGLHSSDGGLTWSGQLAAAGQGIWSGNTIAVDLAQLRDLAGNAGSGSFAGAVPYDIASDPLTASIALDGTQLLGDGSLHLTIRFSAPVDALDPAALGAPHADITGLTASSDGQVWTATLVPHDSGVFDDSNAVSVDLARLHDRFGNAGFGLASSGNYVVDTVVWASVGRIDLPGGGAGQETGVTRDNHAAYAGTLTRPLGAGQSVEVTVDGQVVGTALPGADAATWHFEGDGLLGDGPHTVGARVVDGAGRASATAYLAYTVDATAPELGGTNVGPDFDPGSAIVLRFSEAVYWNAGGGLLLATPGGVTRTLAPGEDAFSDDHRTLTLPAAALGLAPGRDYTLAVDGALSDLAGNPLRAPAIIIHTAGSIDTTPPTADSVVPITAKGMYRVGDSIAFTVHFSEPVYVLGGAPVMALNNGGYAELERISDDRMGAVFLYTVTNGSKSTPRLDLANTTDLLGHIADAAGNPLDAAHVRYTHLDNGAGNIAIVVLSAPAIAAASDSGAKGDGITSDHAPVITGSGALPHAQLYVLLNGDNKGSVKADANGNWSSSDLKGLAPGSYNVNVVEIDTPVRIALSPVLALTIADAPALAAFLAADSNSGAPDDLVTNVARPAFTGSAEAGTVVDVYADDIRIGGAVADAAGAWRFAVPTALSDGTHTITLASRDNLGHVTPRTASHPLVVTIDTHAPDAPGRPLLDASGDGGVTGNTTPTLAGSAAESFAGIDIYDGATLLGRTGSGADGTWTFTVPAAAALSEGDHVLTARQVDAAGNVSAASAPSAITVDTRAPTVTAANAFVQAAQDWIALTFSEAIVFARGGALDMLDASNRVLAHYTADVRSNWHIVAGADGVANVLELKLGTAAGSIHLADSDALQDPAGNVALVGTYTLPGGVA